jgi:uncharacterized membrane protein SpoIIM required for sporulation
VVIEFLQNPFVAQKKPSKLILLGMLYTFVGLVFAWWIFKEYSSIIFIFFTSMAAIPLIYNLMKFEEKKTLSYSSEQSILKHHSRALTVMLSYFLGVVILTAVVFLVISPSYSEVLFSAQLNTISNLGHQVSFDLSEITGHVTSSFSTFSLIFFNNMRVLAFCLLFSLIYGMGAIFVLTWNASIIGVALANLIRSEIIHLSSVVGLPSIFSYIGLSSCGVLRFFLHGVPEIAAYIIAALAGGILSVSIIMKHLRGKNLEKILLDVVDLLFIAIVLLFIASLIEVWITPLLFNSFC